MNEGSIALAIKCAPVPDILANVVNAGITGVELYTNLKWLENIQGTIKTCLDLEHFQMQTSGLFEDVLPQIISPAKHIHLTGYFHGSKCWHTHLHHSPEHVKNILNLISLSGYQGYVVSEGKTSLQTLSEFRKLNKFFIDWKSSL